MVKRLLLSKEDLIMKKKIYKKPEMQEYKLQSRAQILSGSYPSYPKNWGGPIGYAPNIDEDDKPMMA